MRNIIEKNFGTFFWMAKLTFEQVDVEVDIVGYRIVCHLRIFFDLWLKIFINGKSHE